VLKSKDAVRVSLKKKTKLSGTAGPRAALKPQEPHSSGPWTPGASAEVLASRGVAVAESWQVTSCRSYLCSREGGTHTSHNTETS
jgi:hypothetical protein